MSIKAARVCDGAGALRVVQTIQAQAANCAAA